MKKIIIVLGGYGYQRNPEGPVDLITKKDGPIEVSDAEAERLVKIGVAKYAAESVQTLNEDEPLNEGEPLNEDDPLKDVTLNELRARAKELGLSGAGSKVELYERIKAAEESQETQEEIEEDNEEPPVLAAAEPEV